MADRYWVGGTAAWDGTAGTKWALTSGAAGGQSVPTSADDVFFDAASGASVVTIAAGNTGAKSITCTGYTGNIGGAANITVSGNITLVAGMTYGLTGTVTFNADATLITAGKIFSPISVNGAGITLTLGDALSIGTAALTVVQGTFTTSASNYNVTAGSLATAFTNTRTISFNGSTVLFSAANPLSINTTNLTFNAGTSQLNISSTAATFAGSGLTYYNVTFISSSTGTKTISDGNTYNNLSFTAPASGIREIVISANQTVNGTFTVAGGSATARSFIRSTAVGTTRTITAATLSGNDCDFRDITISGGAAGTSPTRAGNCGGNTGITFPAAKTVYWNLAGTQNWNATAWATSSTGSPAANNFPLAQDTATFTNDGAAGTVSLGAIYNLPNIDASLRTSAMTLNINAATSIYGSFTLGSGVTVTGTSVLYFNGRSTMTFTSAGKTITFPVFIDTPSGTFQLGDAFSSSSSVSLYDGVLNAVSYNLTCASFDSAYTNSRTITMGSGLWTLSGTGTVWNTGTTTGLTFNRGSADILLSNTTTTARTFSGGGRTFNKLTIGGATGTSTLTINGANTFTELASTKTVAHTIVFGANQTVTTWSITGTSGNVVTVQSSVSGSSTTLTKSGGGFLTGIDYLNVRDIIGSPVSDTWYIGANSVINTTAPNSGYALFTTQRTDNAVVVLTSTSSTTWTVPNDWNNGVNNIHLIGGGGGGAGSYVSGNNRAAGGGGGGGGYTKLTNQTLTVGGSITYQAGSAGTAGTASGNGGAGGTTSWNSGAATAGGGGGGTAATTPTSAGGTAGTGTTFNGGAGGRGEFGNVASTGYGGGGGGGAGGPNGAGGAGGIGFGTTASTNIAGGGGGGNGGGTNGGNASSGVGGTGGNNSSSVGGGASNTSGAVGGGGGGSVSAASVGGNGVDIFGIGSGGGGGGADDSNRTNTGGFYGSGGGGAGITTAGATQNGSAGRQGAIIIVYTPSAGVTATGNFFSLFQ